MAVDAILHRFGWRRMTPATLFEHPEASVRQVLQDRVTFISDELNEAYWQRDRKIRELNRVNTRITELTGALHKFQTEVARHG